MGYRYLKSFGARSKGFIYDTSFFRRFKTFQFQIKSVVLQDNGSLIVVYTFRAPDFVMITIRIVKNVGISLSAENGIKKAGSRCQGE